MEATTEHTFQPKIVGFFCNWCTYLAADLAGVSRMHYAHNLRIVRVMCSGRVHPEFVLWAFKNGADGVLLGGCHPGDCHYIEGNYKNLRRYLLLKKLLTQLGIDPRRLRLEWISASEADKLKRVANEFTEELRALGPLDVQGNLPDFVLPERVSGDGGVLPVEEGVTHPAPTSRGTPLKRGLTTPAATEGKSARQDELTTPAATERQSPLERGAERSEAGCVSQRDEPAQGEKQAGKPKIGLYWAASCGGCEEAVVDLAGDLLTVVDKVDIAFWPVALDFKREDVEAMAYGELLATFINGAVRLSEQEEVVKLLRRKSKLIVAFGACAQMGGIPGLANAQSRDDILDFYYHAGPIVDNPMRTVPDPAYTEEQLAFELPVFYEDVRALDQVIDVDYYIPGCAPTPEIVKNALLTLLSGDLPPRGAVLASDRALCHECPLNETKPDEGFHVEAFKRPFEVDHVDPETCLLQQGLVCLGPVTRGGCGALCVNAHMPCTGCFGPLDGVKDFGATALSFVASLIDANEEEEIQRIIDRGIPDPLGTFYMYSLPKSLLFRRLLVREAARRHQTEEETDEVAYHG